MDESVNLTPEQLYHDLVEAYKRPALPRGAFNKTKFARDTNRTPSDAARVLLSLYDNGHGVLDRVQIGKEFWYWHK